MKKIILLLLLFFVVSGIGWYEESHPREFEFPVIFYDKATFYKPVDFFDSLFLKGVGDTTLTLTWDGWKIIKKHDAFATDTVTQTVDEFTWVYHNTGSQGGTIKRQLRFVDPATWRDSTNMNMIIGRIDTTGDLDVSGEWVTCSTLIWTNVGRNQTTPLAPGFYRIYTNATDQTSISSAYKGALVIEGPNVIDATSDDYGQLRIKMKTITFDAFGWFNSPMDVYGEIAMIIGSATDTASLILGSSSARVFDAIGFQRFKFVHYADPETLILITDERAGTGEPWFIHTIDSAGVNLDTVMMHGGILIAKKRVESPFGDFTDSVVGPYGKFTDSLKVGGGVDIRKIFIRGDSLFFIVGTDSFVGMKK